MPNLPKKSALCDSAKFRVALITMPFFPISHPSLQLGLLHSLAQEEGFHVDSFHLNLHMASHLPKQCYDLLSEHRGRLTSEWLFAKTAFGSSAVSFETYFAEFPEETRYFQKSDLPLTLLKKIYEEIAPRFLTECMKIADWGKYNLIGFSSIFQQNVASLALAKRIKSRFPSVKIIFGGANMEGEMGPEYLRAFDFVDYVAIGEADVMFPALLRSLSTGDGVEHISGLAYRLKSDVQVNSPAPPIQDLDSLPSPNYDDYFTRFKSLKLSTKSDFLLIETARGCWWGEKHHCTFCGLNGLNMKFRAKSIRRVLAEIHELNSKYGTFWFCPTDNILDLKYIREFFGETEKLSRNFRFGWEIKSNLTREQIRHLQLGGMRIVQPGIESLSSYILRLMRKGCTMLQNLVTLKWCRYYNIQVGWNLLYGFPGERDEDYEKELIVLKLISHLQPPYGCGRIWLERFAPYYFDQEHFPVRNIRPDPSYALIYPSTVSLDKIAYFFDYEMENTAPEEVHLKTKEWVTQWKQAWKAGCSERLTFRRSNGRLMINDNRSLPGRSNRVGVYEFLEPASSMYEFCSDTYRSIRQVAEEIRNQTGSEVSEESIRNTLDSFCEEGFMVGEEGKYLSLALPEPVDASWSCSITSQNNPTHSFEAL